MGDVEVAKKSKASERKPHWQNVGDYPDPRSTSLDRWAFEFLVRNADFRKAIKGIGQLKGPRNDPDSPFRKRWTEIANQFGVAYALHPSWGLDSPVRFRSAPYTIGDAKLISTGEHVFIARYEEWGTAFLFDRRQSIDRQLAVAKVILKKWKKIDLADGLASLPRTHRNRKPDYRSMLRILDGLDEGATQVGIARELFPDNKKGTDAARDQVKVLLAEARRLRDGGYRYLTILRSPGT